mmetsp:Transcript_30889/g.78091  ORF Transcript_30889/g.78091 Transcript_30889/m.78091 type:complete len:297 (-) Transcript_30889:208-1098(-)
MGQSQSSCCLAAHADDFTEQVTTYAADESVLPSGDALAVETSAEPEPLPSLLLSKGPAPAESTSPEIKPETRLAEEVTAPAQPASLGGGSQRPTEAAADAPHITYDDSVPGSLRYGPRELRHMQALGLIPKTGGTRDAPPMGPAVPATGHAARLRGAEAVRDNADAQAESKAQRQMARKAQKQAEKLDASLKVRAFLDRHGFETVKSKKRRFFRAGYPLHAAVRENDADIVALLLRAGASYRKPDSAGRSPLQLAQYLNNRAGSHTEVIRILQGAPTATAILPSSGSASSSGPHDA